ncbi:hypothetical protein H5410_041033 [Solanum commersonii]|uniref:Uncharacterized protein n=1 Tax=Solanum commersonii TaxID=4109 RepID=A0A9J5XSI6_SOLCO|nr:hypothetical protein H5410_041033 [Solanum commersonii]
MGYCCRCEWLSKLTNCCGSGSPRIKEDGEIAEMEVFGTENALKDPICDELREWAGRIQGPLCGIGDLNVIASIEENLGARVFSDHATLQITMKKNISVGPRYFKILEFLDNKDGFLHVVKGIWEDGVEDNPMWILHHKLKRISKRHSVCSRKTLGDFMWNQRGWRS